MTIATVAACLAPLPDPAVCPAPAQNDYCQLAPAFTFDDGGGFDPDSGFPDDVGLPCTCSDKCARAACPSGTACYPAPDCPPAVRSAYPTAACGQLDVPVPDTNASTLNCACGTDKCALACDGAGIVLGPSQGTDSSQGFALVLPPDLPSSGALRAMVRMRGSGVLTLTLARSNANGDASSGVAQTGILSFHLPNTLQEFADEFDPDPSASYTWTSSSDRPDLLFVSNDGASTIEIDCIVPFYVQ